MIRAWRADGGGVRSVTADEALATGEGDAPAWIDADDEDEPGLRPILERLRVHPLVLEDILAQVNRPKVDDYGTYLYLVVHSARWEPSQRPAIREIDVLLGPRLLVTSHDGSTRSVATAAEHLGRRPEVLARGPAYLLHFLLDVLVDNYLPIADQISDEIDDLEEHVMRGGGPRVDARILRVRRGIAALRRIVGPQRDTVLALTRDEFRVIPADVRPYLRDVYDRLARVSDLLDSFRDEVSGLLELNATQNSNRINSTIKVLTVIATLVAPLTVITSYYGMNFDLAVFKWPHGELYVLGVLALATFITWWVLKRRGWL